jgi:hypothetical protein
MKTLKEADTYICLQKTTSDIMPTHVYIVRVLVEVNYPTWMMITHYDGITHMTHWYFYIYSPVFISNIQMKKAVYITVSMCHSQLLVYHINNGQSFEMYIIWLELSFHIHVWRILNECKFNIKFIKEVE